MYMSFSTLSSFLEMAMRVHQLKIVTPDYYIGFFCFLVGYFGDNILQQFIRLVVAVHV